MIESKSSDFHNSIAQRILLFMIRASPIIELLSELIECLENRNPQKNYFYE